MTKIHKESKPWQPLKGLCRSLVPGMPLSQAMNVNRDRDASRIVGMGGSAGGLEAFAQFFSHLPADTGLAFVLVPHLEPTHKGMMPELLARHTKMQVVEGEDGMEVQPNHVYVIPPNADLAILHGKLQVLEPVALAGPADAHRFLLSAVGGGPEGKGHRHYSLGHGERRHAGPEGHQGRLGDGDGARAGLGQV